MMQKKSVVFPIQKLFKRHKKHKISDIEDVAYFEPYYLKDFIALKPKS